MSKRILIRYTDLDTNTYTESMEEPSSYENSYAKILIDFPSGSMDCSDKSKARVINYYTLRGETLFKVYSF